MIGEAVKRVLPPEILHYIGKDKTQRCSYEPMALLDNRRDDGIEDKIVWQVVGANQSNNTISRKFLQLDLATQSIQNHCGVAYIPHCSTLDLA